MIQVSVIIPTYNGANKLPGILKSLAAQEFKQFELIIVIDGSTDNTVEVLNSFKDFFRAFSVVTQPNKGRAGVRNRGAKEAKSDLLLFFDDDMLPDPFCVLKHVEHHEQWPDTILTGAQIDMCNANGSEIQKFKHFLSEKWMNKIKSNTPLPRGGLFLTAANLSVSKKTFNQLGGFDERLTDAEDFDLAIRAYRVGIGMFFNPSAFALHNDKISFLSYIERQRQYANAHKKLIELNPQLIKDGFLTEKRVSGLKKYFFRFFAYKVWMDAGEKEWLKHFLIKPIRYKIYDWIITSNSIYYPEKVNIR